MKPVKSVIFDIHANQILSYNNHNLYFWDNT